MLGVLGDGARMSEGLGVPSGALGRDEGSAFYGVFGLSCGS